MRTRTWRLVAAGIALAIVPGGLAAARSAQAARPNGVIGASGSEWRLVEDSGVLAHSAELVSTGPRDVWAFGAYAGRSWIVPKAFHWDGEGWRTVRLPVAKPGMITTASASGPGEVWAGYGGKDGASAVALRWDGRAWSVARDFPDLETIDEVLALGPSDVWIFGTGHGRGETGETGETGVTWHLTSGGWVRSVLPAPVVNAGARSANDIWAVAGSQVLHYDGRGWRNVPLTGVLPGGDMRPVLSGVAVTADEVWLPVELEGTLRPSAETLLLRRTGETWTQEKVTAQAGRWQVGGTAVPVPDGRGGLWLSGSMDENGSDSALVHRSAAGVWTRKPIKLGGRQVEISTLIAIPGTRHLLAAGSRPALWSLTGERGGVLYLP